MVSKDTLVMVVVDTNRLKTTQKCPELLRKTGKIVVTDHHRQK